MLERKTGTKSASDIDIAVGVRIRALRNEKGVSQTVLGNALGITFQQVQKYERGANRVPAGRLSAIATYLKVPMSSLLPDNAGDAEASLGDLMTASQKGCRLAKAFLALEPLGQLRLVELAETLAGATS